MADEHEEDDEQWVKEAEASRRKPGFIEANPYTTWAIVTGFLAVIYFMAFGGVYVVDLCGYWRTRLLIQNLPTVLIGLLPLLFFFFASGTDEKKAGYGLVGILAGLVTIVFMAVWLASVLG
jgi:hypothetical protein